MQINQILNSHELIDWFNTGKLSGYISDHFCSNRFVFNSRLSSYEKTLLNQFNESCAYLILASCGEIGNNCFDHNLGHWQENPGCLFIREDKYCIIADRGRGIKNSLSHVIKLDNDKYVEYAYNHIISGRAPEKRGNGLKFVKRSIESCNISLFSYSNNEHVQFGQKPTRFDQLKNQGVFTILSW